MKAGAWDCQGLKSIDSPTFPFLRWFVSSQALNFMFLSETKSKVKDSSDLPGV